MNVNKAIIVGRVGQDPSVKTTSGGTSVANFSVATSHRVGSKDNKKDETEWHKIVVWGQLAEFLSRNLKKGMLVFVEGQLRTRKWEDKSGQVKYSTEIHAEKVQLLFNKKAEGSEEDPGESSES